MFSDKITSACARTDSSGTNARCVSAFPLTSTLHRMSYSGLVATIDILVLTSPGLCHPLVENPCVLQPCGNRGLCRSDRRGNYNCACKVGHTGKDCEKGQETGHSYRTSPESLSRMFTFSEWIICFRIFFRDVPKGKLLAETE